MPRDRMSSLRQVQEMMAQSGSSRETLNNSLPNYESTSIQMEDVDGLEEFFEQISTIRELLDEMNEDVELVKNLHSDILSSPIADDPKRAQLEDLMAKLKKTSTKIRTKLKGIEREIEDDESRKESDARIRIKKTQHGTFLRLFIDSMSDFQLAQTDYRDRCKGRFKRQLEITGTYFDDEKIENMMESGDLSVFTRDIMTDTAKAKEVLADIEARHKDILQLEKSIRELHDMFVEMTILVERQGDTVDTIVNHVINAKDHVDEGTHHLRDAKIYKDAALRKKLCLFAVAIVVLVVVSVILLASLGVF